MVDESTLSLAPASVAAPSAAILTATIIYHPDVSRIGGVARLGGQCELSRSAPVFAAHDRLPGPLADRYISRTPLRITRNDDGVVLEAPASGRYAVNGRVIADSTRYAFDNHTLDRGLTIELSDRIVLLLKLVTPESAHPPNYNLIGESTEIVRIRSAITRVADLNVPVMLRGETGTGKELVARAIHAANGSDRPFVAVNIAALPPATAASELFGHARGAFTGAMNAYDGLFVRADGGTLFLDEIGETPFDIQPMLLRVLETSEIRPLGASRSRRVNVRIIVATDADLETQIAEHGFRSALFHRLAGYQLIIAPLRDRRDDIGRLLLHFLHHELTATGDIDRLDRQRNAARLWLPAPLVARLANYDWPGNVRQLRNVIRQLAISNRGSDEVRADPVLDRMLAVSPPDTPVRNPATSERRRRNPGDISEDELVAAMRDNAWRAGPAADQLCVSRSALYNLLERSKTIRKARDIPEDELRRALAATGGDLDAIASELKISLRALKLRIAELGWE